MTPIDRFKQNLAIPAIVAPMFLISGPELVLACCNSGVAASFPALNQRSSDGFAAWMTEIAAGLAPNAAPYGVNLIVHKSNPRLNADLDLVVKHKVPFVITSLGAVKELVEAVHSYGGLVFHDVISRRHAEKAAGAGVDGIIAVSAGAGGHAGVINPFALVAEIRSFFAGQIILSGAISTGRDVAAARMIGADFAYLGTRFIASQESMASDAQKEMTAKARSADIVYTPAISGVNANFLRPSIVAAGLDPDNLQPHGGLDMENEAKAWKNVWSAGQGVAGFETIDPAAEICRGLISSYRQSMLAAAHDPYAVKA